MAGCWRHCGLWPTFPGGAAPAQGNLEAHRAQAGVDLFFRIDSSSPFVPKGEASSSLKSRVESDDLDSNPSSATF